MGLDLYKEVIANCIGHDIHACLTNDAPTGAVLLTYCAIDAMSFLSMPIDQEEVSRNDFIAWVEKYMKTDPSQPYQYRGVDLYGARCGIAHNYGVESRLSREGACKIFAYQWGSLNHSYNVDINPGMVVLGVDLFIKNFFDAVDRFLSDIEDDSELKKRVDSRLPKLFRIRHET